MRAAAVLLALFALPVWAAPAVVQVSSVGNFPQGFAGDTAQVTLTGVGSGNSLIVGVFGFGSGATVSASCSDGSAFTQDAHRNEYTTVSTNYLIASIHHRHAVASGSHTITCTISSGTFTAYGWITAAEVSGLANVAVDATSVNGGTSTNPTTGNATPSTTSSIAFGAFVVLDASNPATFGHPPSGYTSVGFATDGSASFTVGSNDYKILSSTSAENPSWASSLNSAWAAVIAIYRATATSALLLRRQRS